MLKISENNGREGIGFNPITYHFAPTVSAVYN